MIRSDIPSNSSMSEEIIRIAIPLLASSAHQLIDFLFGADIDAAGGFIKDQDIGFRRQGLCQDHFLLVAAAQVDHPLLQAGCLDINSLLVLFRNLIFCFGVYDPIF